MRGEASAGLRRYRAGCGTRGRIRASRKRRCFIAPDLGRDRIGVLPPDVALASDAFRLLWRKGHPLESEMRRLAGELRAIPLR